MVLSGWFVDGENICVMVDGKIVTEVKADKGGNEHWSWMKVGQPKAGHEKSILLPHVIPQIGLV